MNQQAVVIMPCGKQSAFDNTAIDFEAVFQALVKPALTTAGLSIFRAPVAAFAGEMPAELMQALLTADVVVADISIGSPGVYYALGIREALRKGGVITLAAQAAPLGAEPLAAPVCIYHLNNCVPDPVRLADDLQALVDYTEKLKYAVNCKPSSRVFQQIPRLAEPDWYSARVTKAETFWRRHCAWEAGLQTAAKAGNVGDLLLLAEESPVAQFRAMAHLQAGTVLRIANKLELALEQFNLALDLLPDQLTALMQKGICLQQLALQGKANHRIYAARLHYISLLKDYPDDPEIWMGLGDMDKAKWVQAWHKPLRTPLQMRELAAENEAWLRGATESYRQAFRRNPGFFRAGIQALTLMQVYQNLTGETRFFMEATAMIGALRYAIEFDPHPTYLSKSTLGELEILVGTPVSVSNAYKEAIALAPPDWAALQASLAHLHLLQALGFHPETVMAGIETLEMALVSLNPPANSWQPRQVILFSGHIIDAPDRAKPRFPPEKAASAAARIADALAGLDANVDDLALVQGAAGGDILFAEACLQRGVRVQLLQPLSETEFIERSILPAMQGEYWRARYMAVRAQLKTPPRNLPETYGTLDEENCNPFERCNRWLLSTALAYGQEHLRFMCLWDGRGSDHCGGTATMVQAVVKRDVPMVWINTDEL